MKRRGLLLGAVAAPCSALAALPAVLQRPAVATPLAPRAALLAAARAGRRVLVAGERGIVLTSDDAGATWAQARVPVQVSLTSMAFADERQGWAAGHFGTLLRTADGGLTWTQPEARATEALDKPFMDCTLAGPKLLAVGAFGLAVEVLPDGQPQSIAARLPNPRKLHLYGVRAAGERVYVAGEQGLLLRSTDQGASFEPLASPYKGSFFGVLVTQAGSVLAYGLRGNVFRSADGGSSWAQVPNPVPVGIGAAIQRADGLLVLAAQNGDLLTSRDDGQSFQRRPAQPPFPAAALAASEGDALVLAGLRGVQRQRLA